MGFDRIMTLDETIDEEWDYWINKSVYSFLFDRVFEVTGLESDDWDRTTLYCEEQVQEGVYDNAQVFQLFEIREL